MLRNKILTKPNFVGFIAILIVLSLLFGNSAVKYVYAQARDIYKEIQLFSEILSLIKNRYVEEKDPKALVRSAIDGMLDSLDPYSQFLDAKAYKRTKEEFQGKFSGIGIALGIRDDYPVVIYPIEGTPAYKAGIIAGDRIIKIEGEETYKMPYDDVVSKLKGLKGTPVNITIEREGEDSPLDFTLIRDEIPVESVPSAFIIRPGIGYIKITIFSHTTATELDKALENLQAQGMKKLILDLRGNTGGLLDQAVEVASRFIEGGKMIVYTKGRIPESTEEYKSIPGVTHSNYPLIVLVDNNSASASEIVTGAIQDWDRGLIVGEATFGKGSVQRLYPVGDESALKLTIAKYYIPSGRCIHSNKPRKKSSKKSDDDESSDSTEKSNEKKSDMSGKELYNTKGGRVVYGGGGITPDVEVKPNKLDKFELMLRNKNTFFNFAVHYKVGRPTINKNFEITDDILHQYKDYLKEKKIEFSEKDFNEHIDFIKLEIKSQIMTAYFGGKEGNKVKVEGDNQILKAIDIISGKETLTPDLAQVLGIK